MTDYDEDKGFRVCECGDGVLLLQAGFDIDLKMCAMCKQLVADREEFFKHRDSVEILSK